MGIRAVRNMASHKDYFLNTLGDVIRLKAAKGQMDQEIFEMWRQSRNIGGLQWNQDGKQRVFNEVVAETPSGSF